MAHITISFYLERAQQLGLDENIARELWLADMLGQEDEETAAYQLLLAACRLQDSLHLDAEAIEIIVRMRNRIVAQQHEIEALRQKIRLLEGEASRLRKRTIDVGEEES